MRRDVCNVCRGRQPGCVCRAAWPRVGVRTGDPCNAGSDVRARHACAGLCEPQVLWDVPDVCVQGTHGVCGGCTMCQGLCRQTARAGVCRWGRAAPYL